jgi:capsular polysaccharide biosynthesis protein
MALPAVAPVGRRTPRRSERPNLSASGRRVHSDREAAPYPFAALSAPVKAARATSLPSYAGRPILGLTGFRRNGVRRVGIEPGTFGRRFWLISAVLLIAGLTIGATATLSTTRMYRATATVGIEPITAAQQGSFTAGQATARTAAGVTALVTTPDVIANLGLPISPTALAKEIAAHLRQRDHAIDISVTDANSRHAARYANAVAARFAEKVVTYATDVGGVRHFSATQIRTATPPASAIGVPWVRNESIGALGGLLVALLVALAQVYRRQRRHVAIAA